MIGPQCIVQGTLIVTLPGPGVARGTAGHGAAEPGQQEAEAGVGRVLGGEVGVVRAGRALGAGLLARSLGLHVGEDVSSFNQVPDNAGPTCVKTLHVLGDTICTRSHALTGFEELAEVRKWSGVVIKIGDELTGGIVQTKLAAFHQRVDVQDGVNHVVGADLALDPLIGTGHRGVADSGNLSLTSRDEEEEGENSWAEAPHAHGKMLTQQLTRLQATEGVVQKITRISQMRKLY